MSKKHSLIPVILCGGAGTRLWPLSRNSFPKQFIPLLERSLFDRTLERLSGLNIEHMIVMCSVEHQFLVTDTLRCNGIENYTLILEPCIRDTAPAVALSALSALDNLGDHLLLVLPSDHLVNDVSMFEQMVSRSLDVAVAGSLVTFGIVPKYAETGYGYICKGGEISDGIYKALEFCEKPSAETAASWIEQGNYYWNSGMFLFKAQTYLDAISRYAPDILTACEKAYAKCSQDMKIIQIDETEFSKSTKISIDYAVMEKAENTVVVPADIDWNDIGSWNSLSALFSQDGQNNAYKGDVVFEQSKNNIVYSESCLVTLLGLNDCVVASTRDAILVAKRDQVQNVKQLVNHLKDNNRREVAEHCKVFRPWGSYESVDAADGFQVKRIIVDPGQKLSLQLHHHRSEHWIIVKGTAHITRGEEEIVLETNQSTYIPVGVKHRLENRDTEPLYFIEVQCGDYLGEDDIVRFEDVYGRVK